MCVCVCVCVSVSASLCVSVAEARQWTRTYAHPPCLNLGLWSPAPEIHRTFAKDFQRVALCIYILHRRHPDLLKDTDSAATTTTAATESKTDEKTITATASKPLPVFAKLFQTETQEPARAAGNAQLETTPFTRLNKSLINLILQFGAPLPRPFGLWERSGKDQPLAKSVFDPKAKSWKEYPEFKKLYIPS